MFDLWRFGLDVQQVMTARVLRMMEGELSPREARRMIRTYLKIISCCRSAIREE